MTSGTGTQTYYVQGSGSGILNQWVWHYKTYFPSATLGGDDAWHVYYYDQAYDVDPLDQSFVGRVILDKVLATWSGPVISETSYTYFTSTDLDVQEKVFDHLTDSLWIQDQGIFRVMVPVLRING